jgi:hypothetical protein
MELIKKFIRSFRKNKLKDLPLQQQAGADIVLEELDEFAKENPTKKQNGKWMTVEKAADIYDVCTATIHLWVKEDKIHSRQPAGRYGKVSVWVED